MNIHKLLILVLVIITNTTFSQQSLNNYKYVIVPKKFDFLKSEDEYQLNSLTKFLFEKEGFTTLFEGDKLPKDLYNDSCIGLKTKVKNESGMFVTKLTIELFDCRNNTVFSSTEGRSKEKEFKKAHHDALRKAFQSIASLDYEYNPVKESDVTKKEKIVEVQEPTDIVKIETPLKVEIEEKLVEAIEEVIPKKVIEKDAAKEAPFAIILYAQENPLGFQLVDSTPKVVYVLLKSNNENVYFLKNKSGIVFKQNNKWFAEFYEGNKLIKYELHIKF